MHSVLSPTRRSRGVHAVTGLVMTLLALTAFGCGATGSASPETTPERDPGPSTSGFAARANAVCDHAEQRIAKLAGGQSVGIATLEASVAVERKAAELLAAIPAPRGMRARYSGLRAAIVRRARFRERFLAAYRTSGRMSSGLVDRANAETVKANHLAEQLSLKDCPPY